MLERIPGDRRNTALVENASFDQNGEHALEAGLRHRDDGADEIVRELVAKGGTELRNLFGIAEPVQPCHQRISQGWWNSAARVIILQYGSRQFFDEQWHSDGSRSHRTGQRIRNAAITREVFHHFTCLHGRKCSNRQAASARYKRPSFVKFG